MASSEDRAAKLAKLTEARSKAPVADKTNAKDRALKALAERKKKLAAQKEMESTRPMPEGWRRVESRSRPGEYVYENLHTEERQAWFPDTAAPEEISAPLVPQGADEGQKTDLKAKNQKALEAYRQKMADRKKDEMSKEVPAGWTRVESRSRPGEMVYENQFTGERQAWFPDKPATKDDAAEAMREKNKAALEARKAKKAADALADVSKPLPEGWRRVESRSRPGEFVYENIHTEERQAWFPDVAAEMPLPAGWRKVESRSFPGEFVYENVYTLDRQAWMPTEPAPTTETQSPEKRTADQLASLAKGRAPPARNVIHKAKCVYDYASENPDEEIDMLEGDVIAVEYKADNGWWVGVNTRTERNGIFPGTYVEIIE